MIKYVQIVTLLRLLMYQVNKLLVLFIGIFLFSQTVDAKIYKWTDKNGKVHYSDKPFDEKSEEIEIKEHLTPEQQNAAKIKANEMIRRQTRRLNNQFEEEYDKRKQQSKKNREQQKLSHACRQAKTGLKILQMQRPVYTTDENGERKFYSDEERKKEIAEIKAAISEHCSE